MSENAQADELYARWLQLRAQGETPTPAQLCAGRPELVPMLEQLIKSGPEGFPLTNKDSQTVGSTVSDSPKNQISARFPANFPWAFDGYVIEGLLGRGGMGVVYRAREMRLDRPVALKMVRFDIEGPEVRNRFEREAKAVARLQHPGIVKLLGFGEADSTCYFTMDLYDGGSLRDHLKAMGENPQKAAAVMETVARAVDYAHEQGILHRDLKPSNILLDAEGQPRVSDFGLAKFVDANETLTASGQFLGTAAYMAPEQIGGPSKKLDRRSDVWSLGVVLYEILAGRRPFVAESSIELPSKIVAENPPSLRKLNARIDKGLETIASKCLEKRPAARYQTAGELADDLARWQRGEPLKARPRRWPAKLAGSIRKRPGRWALALVALGVLIAMTFIPWPSAPPTEQERVEQSREKAIAEIQRSLAQGKRVELIGKHRVSDSIRWIFRATLEKNKQGIYEIGASGVGMLELLPDPGINHYRVDAELQQISLTNLPTAQGVYVCGVRTTHDPFPCYFAPLEFVEFQRMPVKANEAVVEYKSSANFNIRHAPNDESFPSSAKLLPEYTLPAPALPTSSGPIRKMSLEVSAEGVAVVFGGNSSKAYSFDKMQTRARSMFFLGKAPNVLPVFGPRQSIGLYLQSASVAVHSVTITPLEP